MRTNGLNKAKVHARMSRITSGSGADYFELRIEDVASGLTVVTAKLDDTQFANLLSNRQAADLDGEVNTSDKLLKKHENKSVSVPLNFVSGPDSDAAFAQVFVDAETANPGWKADRDERYNHYRYDHKNKMYSVTLRRWVEVT